MGDINLLKQGEIMMSTAEGYTILRKRLPGGTVKTYVVIPLEDFKNEKDIEVSKMDFLDKEKSYPKNGNSENIEGD